ncbi:MAG: PAS domain S-box protein [Anaerolineales bacterium]|nr:PAS domain S-box protein [Anaerolineales bacterium]
MNLLIVDDIPTDLKLLCVQLEAEGHVVFVAHDGVDALALLERQRVDVVISDVLMPRMDGYRLCHEIRKHARLHDLPIIIYTFTYTSPGDEKLALDVGADKYLKKPASVETIITTLHEVIAMPHAASRPEALQEIEVLKEYSERLVSKLAEKNSELIASEVKFRSLVEQSIVGIYIAQDDQLVYVNPSMTEIFGWSEKEMASRTVYDFIVPEDHALVREYIRKRISGEVPGVHYSLRMLHQSGAVLEIDLHGSRTEYNGRPAMMGMLLDITDRKRAEERIQRQLEHLTALSAIDRVITSSFDLRLIFSEILKHVTTELGIDAADILVLNSSLQMLEFSAGRGFRTKAAEKAQVRLGESHAGRVALERQLVKILNLKDQPDNLLLSKRLAGEDFVCYYGVPLIAKGQVKGVLEVFHRTALEPDAEWLDFLNALAEQTAIAIDNATLFDRLQRSNSELVLAYDATIEGWSRALDLRDKETEGHSQRVTALTLKLARASGMTEAELVHVRHGALLHDIGKMGVPDHILLKPGSLTDEEWVAMRKHPQLAFELLSPIAYLRDALDIPYCHHEKWDGTGYPRGLKGEQIPLSARIFAIVDAWDALRSDRPYRVAWSREKVIEHIKAGSGSHFDPQVVDAFLVNMEAVSQKKKT